MSKIDSLGRNVGRKEPLVSDDWRPRSKAAHRKPFGIRITYTSIFGGRKLSWTQWYATDKGREAAMKALSHSYPWRKEQQLEKVER